MRASYKPLFVEFHTSRNTRSANNIGMLMVLMFRFPQSLFASSIYLKHGGRRGFTLSAFANTAVTVVGIRLHREFQTGRNWWSFKRNFHQKVDRLV